MFTPQSKITANLLYYLYDEVKGILDVLQALN